VYRFDWEAPRLGAAHAVDVPFTFGTFDREGWGEVVGYDARAEELAARWRGAWASFAATRDPGRSTWAPYGDRRTTTLFSAAGVRAIDDPEAPTRQCWMP
jgi:carboxylesterase type B